MNLDKEVFEISLKDIMPNRFQPREVFDDQALTELSTSIKEHGVIQPITVRKVGDKYEIIAGERRFRASKLAGKETIPALIRDMDDKEAAKIALLENLQRKDLTAIEQARTYETILKLDNITQEELASNLGVSQSTIANKLRLLNLDEEVQIALLNERISERHARSLLNVTDPEKQKELLHKIIQNRLTVRDLDEEIEKMNNPMNLNQEKNLDELNNEPKDFDYIFNNPDNNLSNQNIEINMPEDVPTNLEYEQLNEIKEEPTMENIKMEEPVQEEPVQPQTNIFASLRIPAETEEEKPVLNETKEDSVIEDAPVQEEPEKQPVMGSIPVQETPSEEQLNTGIYDLRFAINNVRQAVQNTEKFGFNIETEEFDFNNVYQIIIKIDKTKNN